MATSVPTRWTWHYLGFFCLGAFQGDPKTLLFRLTSALLFWTQSYPRVASLLSNPLLAFTSSALSRLGQFGAFIRHSMAWGKARHYGQESDQETEKSWGYPCQLLNSEALPQHCPSKFMACSQGGSAQEETQRKNWGCFYPSRPRRRSRTCRSICGWYPSNRSQVFLRRSGQGTPEAVGDWRPRIPDTEYPFQVLRRQGGIDEVWVVPASAFLFWQVPQEARWHFRYPSARDDGSTRIVLYQEFGRGTSWNLTQKTYSTKNRSSGHSRS